MKQLSIFVLLCALSLLSQGRFIRKMYREYERDSSIRPSDSLLYIPHIMNLVSNSSFDRMTIEERRQKLFAVLSKGRLHFSYHYALDTLNGDVYCNPRGDMDCIEKTRPKELYFYPIELNKCAESFTNKMNALILYAQKRHPDCIFEIANIVGLDCEVYWAIIDGELFAVQFIDADCSLHEYTSQEFLTEVASDDIFSFSIRLDLLNSQQ